MKSISTSLLGALLLLFFSLPINECLAQGPNPTTNHVCRFPEQTDDVHSNAPAISAVADAGGPYAFTGTNFEISVSGGASVITNGTHVKTTSFLACSCGATNGILPYSSPYTVTPETYTYHWTFTPESGGTGTASEKSGTGQSFSDKVIISGPGVYDLTADFVGIRSGCDQCRCEAGASTNCTVYQLTVTDDLWLGLDRRDDGGNVIGKGTATLIPSGSATYAWELTAEGESSVVCFLTNMVDNTTEYWPMDKEASSRSFLDQKLTGTATISDVYPEFSLSASTNFTVVKVDVSLDGLDETNEEKIGGFVQYHYDFPEYTNWHSELKSDSGYKFIKAQVRVTPKVLPAGDDRVTLFYDGEEYFTNAVFVLNGDEYVPAKTNYAISELPDFYIHAHSKEGKRMFRAVHTRSQATDQVKVTVVDVDIDIDSDHTSAFGGPDLTVFEDWIEDGVHADETNKPLKFVVFNDYYQISMLGMPGYADTAMDTPTGPVIQNLLVPVEFKYPASLTGVDAKKIKIKIEYAGGDPSAITPRQLPNGETEWPTSGSMRLWLKKEGRNRAKITESSSGDFIPAGQEFEVSKLRGVTTFYLEGVNPSQTIGQDQIKAMVTISYGTTSVTMEDELKCTVIRAALDVDTFNDSGVSEDPHEPGAGEDHYEDMADRVGKILLINNKDKDNDGIPDYLDGYDRYPEIESDIVNMDEIFVPLAFSLPAGIDYSNVTVRVTYEGADPKSDEENNPAKIRIWTRKGNEARSKENFPSGDYLAPSEYKANELGFVGSTNRVIFYVESVKLSEEMADIQVLFEVKIDDRNTEYIAADAVRFTSVDIDLEIHKPKVIDAGESAISEQDELTKGSVTFVNLDNDDKDQFFDYNPDGTQDAYVVDGDNELVKVTLKLQPSSVFSSGAVKLEVTDGAENVKMFTENTKAYSKAYNSGTPLSVTSFTTSGGSLTKDIWVEGISPQSEPRKTKLKLTYDKAQGFSDETALTVIGVEEVEWKAIGDQIIEKDPNWPAGLSPQGWRVFPDKYTPEEAAASHEKVDVSVKLSVSPPFPIKLFLRAFDVDDPSYTDGIITDNFGSLVMNDEGLERDNVYPNNSAEPDWQKQNPTCGKFEGFNISFNIKELDLLPENKTYSAVFCLSPCPGDNFRIVANGDKSFLEQLENNDTLLNIGSTVSEKLQNLQRIVDPMATGVPSGSPSVQEVRVSEKYCSRTLTTWRKLWIERDSMSPIPEEKRWVQGIVERYSVRNLSDVNGNSYSRFTGTMYDAYEGRPPSKDAFEGGELYFKIWSSNNEYYLMGAENGGPFYITRSNKLFYNSFEIWPALSASQLAVIQEIHSNAGNVFYKAKDDADYTVFDQKQILSIDSLKEAYYEAYIDPVYADEFNDKKIQPYIREVSLYSLMGALNLSRDLTSSIWMWTTHVVASFEGVYLKDADLDPDDCMSDKINNGVPPYLGAADVKLGSDAELFGLAFSLNNNSALFLETIRDARYDAKTEPSLTTTNLTVHEITHVGGIGIGHFNGDDGIHGVLVPNLMFKDPQIINQSTRFRAQTIRSLRRIEKW